MVAELAGGHINRPLRRDDEPSGIQRDDQKANSTGLIALGTCTPCTSSAPAGVSFMSHSWKITICRKRSGGGPEFEPAYLVVNKGDQIFWVNNDIDPHWPGLMNADGTINETFFMQNQILPSDSSTVFIPGLEGDFTYSCSLHQNEMGRILVYGNGGGGIGP